MMAVFTLHPGHISTIDLTDTLCRYYESIQGLHFLMSLFYIMENNGTVIESCYKPQYKTTVSFMATLLNHWKKTAVTISSDDKKN